MRIERWMQRIILIALFFAFFGNEVPVSADNSGLQNMIRRTQRELKNKKQAERSALNKLINNQKALDRSEKNLKQIDNRISSTRRKIEATTGELRDLERQLGTLEDQQAHRRVLMGKRIEAVYKYGFISYLQVFLQADSFADFVSLFEMVTYFIKDDIQTLRDLESSQQHITRQQQEILTKKERLEEEQGRYASLQKQYSSEQKKHSRFVARTQAELNAIQTDRKRLEEALNEYERTSREIAEQIRKNQKAGGVRLGTGSMIWPLRGRISSPYGYRYHPVLKKRRFHNGIDIAVPTGTPVLAADSGVVLVSGWRGGYGYYVAIDHGNGLSTAYAHNSRLLVNVGDTVIRGQRIALAGSTGMSTGPHLHFEVRINGQPTNPRPYLP